MVVLLRWFAMALEYNSARITSPIMHGRNLPCLPVVDIDYSSASGRSWIYMAKVAFIGLGVMGYPMAGHLAKRGGHDVTVFNRTTAKAEKWVSEFGGRAASTPAAAVSDAEFVFSCVGNDDDLRSVTIGPNGAFAGMQKGAVFID